MSDLDLNSILDLQGGGSGELSHASCSKAPTLEGGARNKDGSGDEARVRAN